MLYMLRWRRLLPHVGPCIWSLLCSTSCRYFFNIMWVRPTGGMPMVPRLWPSSFKRWWLTRCSMRPRIGRGLLGHEVDLTSPFFVKVALAFHYFSFINVVVH